MSAIKERLNELTGHLGAKVDHLGTSDRNGSPGQHQHHMSPSGDANMTPKSAAAAYSHPNVLPGSPSPLPRQPAVQQQQQNANVQSVPVVHARPQAQTQAPVQNANAAGVNGTRQVPVQNSAVGSGTRQVPVQNAGVVNGNRQAPVQTNSAVANGARQVPVQNVDHATRQAPAGQNVHVGAFREASAVQSVPVTGARQVPVAQVPVMDNTPDTPIRRHATNASVPSIATSGTSYGTELRTPSTPTAPGPPNFAHPKAEAQAVAREVPTPAREAVVARDNEAPPQPPVDEKAMAAAREIVGVEPVGTVIEGIEDDTLWVMLRSFNNQVNHVLHPARNTPAREPDLRHTNLPNVPYRSDTLKSNLERLITGLAPPASRGVSELARLTDWHGEFTRTAMYCSGYFLAWVLGWTMVVCTIFWMVLICFPDTRRILFPYRPPPADPPPLMVTESVTAAEDRTFRTVPAAKTQLSRAEQAEEHSVEVAAVMAGYARALLLGSKGEEGNSVVGTKDLVTDWDDPELVVNDKEGNLMGYKTSRADPEGKLVDVDGVVIPVRKDKVAKKEAKNEVERKREELVTWMAKTTETSLGISADFIEIMQKAMSPPVVYPDQYARFKIAGLLIVPALALHFIPARVMGRSATFGFGAVFWGHEWIRKGLREFVRLVPNWKEYVDPRNSILSGVPTDAQLTLHLLRVSEEVGEPLPLPPVAPSLEETKAAIREAQDPHGMEAEKEAMEGAPEEPKGMKKAAKKTKSKTKGAFKKVARKMAGMGSDVAVVGEEQKRGKIDTMVLKAKWGDDFPPGGFAAKLDGSKGHLFLDEEEGCLTWMPLMSKTPEKIWYIDDLVEMKKDGLGVSRLALAAMSGAEIASLGLTLRFCNGLPPQVAQNMEGLTEEQQKEQQLLIAQSADEVLEFKGVAAREELFNRLIAMGNQRWEML